VRLDATRARQLNEREVDDEEFQIRCVIRSYDKFNGRGKVESKNFDKTMYFIVEPDLRAEMRDRILEAMAQNYVTCVVAAYRDQSGEITSLILRDIEEF
jgi:hypothetical protein